MNQVKELDLRRDNMEKEDDLIIFLLLIAFFLFAMIFVIDYINLRNFKKCWENNFYSKNCETYLNY